MAVVLLDGSKLVDRTAFHQACKDAFGFPDFYGGNMDAWVDCLSGLRDDDGMTRFALAPDEVLVIEVMRADALRQQAPDMLAALQDGVAEVNTLLAESGEKPALKLILR